CSAQTLTSDGYNFDDDGTCGFNQSTDQSNAGNPLLGALGDNGGPTPTMLPQSGSPLLDKIPPPSCSEPTDPRGVTRPQGPQRDIGAVEVEVARPPSPPVTPPPNAPAPVVQQPKFTG